MKYGYYEGRDLIKPINYFIVGAHILVVCSPTDYISKMITLENVGWEVRDCIKVLLKDKTLQVGLLRKPFKGTVANNVLTNGCGGINIDATRIKMRESQIASIEKMNKEGRFPANLVLDLSSANMMDSQSGIPKSTGEIFGVKCNKREENGKCLGHPTANGSLGGGIMRHGEEVKIAGRFPANLILDSELGWILDGQSGVTKSNVRPPNDVSDTGNNITHGAMKGIATQRGFVDKGGASRFFYNFKSEAEMKSYLIKLVMV
jgi:hypothetical protein